MTTLTTAGSKRATKRKATKAKKANPPHKVQYKRTQIILSEVENGYEVEVQWAFNEDTCSANHEDNIRDFVAKSEEDALELVRKLVPTLIADDGDSEDEE